MKDFKRILLVRECCIGDILMSSPLVRALRKKYPQAKIDYMVGDWARVAAEGIPYIDEVIPYIKLRRDPWHKSLKALYQLRKRKYDVVFLSEIGRMSSLVALLSGAKVRVGCDFKDRSKILLTHRLDRSVNDIHERDSFLKLGQLIGVEDDGMEMDFAVAEEDENFARDYLRQWGVTDNDKLIGMFPGGGKNPGTLMESKRWPLHLYRQLSERLIAERYRILVLGGDSDVELVKGLSERKPEILTLTGIPFKRLAAMIKKCDVFVANDCGPMHLSAAVRTPTVSLFGPSDDTLIAPAGNHIAIRKEKECPPCYQQIIGTFEKNCDVRCLKAITVDVVFNAVQQLLQSEVAPQEGRIQPESI